MTTDLFSIDVATIPAEQIPAALTTLAALQAALAARLMAPTEKPEPNSSDADKMLRVDEVATRLRKSTKWVYRRVKTLPFARRIGPRSWVFSETGLNKWLARQRV